jgi:hypothetical protein
MLGIGYDSNGKFVGSWRATLSEGKPNAIVGALDFLISPLGDLVKWANEGIVNFVNDYMTMQSDEDDGFRESLGK